MNALLISLPSAPKLPPPLALVKPSLDRRALRTARVLNVFVEECLSLDVRDARQLQKAFGWKPKASLRLGVRSAPSDVYSLVVCALDHLCLVRDGHGCCRFNPRAGDEDCTRTG
jgi:hypothetical protein